MSAPPLLHPSIPPLRSDEFPAGAAQWPPDLSRRDFVQLMSASLALAGLTGCGRPTLDKIVPSVAAPEKSPSANARWYATAVPSEGYARGVLVKTVDGRPIKLEGNPDHPESVGATDAITQAAILSLYDPDRSPAPRRRGETSSWHRFETEWNEMRGALATTRSAGFAVLTEPTTSPTLRREIHALLDAYPEARWYQHTALGRYDNAGLQPDYDFAAADVILAIGGDCFHQHPAALRYARAFASRRRVEHGSVNLNRFYAIEPTLTLTGALADVRLALAPHRLARVLNQLADSFDGAPNTAGLSVDERSFVERFARELAGGRPAAACVVGAECDAEIHAWAEDFNARFAGNVVQASKAVRSDDDPRCRGSLAEFIEDVNSGTVTTLAILGANPIYTSAADQDLPGALRRIPMVVHFGEHVDETASMAQWHLPAAHFLESWGDLRSYGGLATIQQPLLEPLHDSRSALQFLNWLRTGIWSSSYDLVRDTWRSASGVATASDFEARWHAALDRGVVDEPLPPRPENRAAGSDPLPRLDVADDTGTITVLLRADSNVGDGRWANNAWLQELPRPFTTIVWDNAALIDRTQAEAMGLTNGDIVACEVGGISVEAPIWILPGQAPGCVTFPLGYGRTAAGQVGNGCGFNAYRLRSAASPWMRTGVTVRKTGKKHSLVSTQEHFTMDGRDLARTVQPHEITQRADRPKPATDLFPAWPRDRYAWGMSIDLGTCTGCSACIVACQAENNIPVVGRDQVARGREMHWLRVDRYFGGEGTALRVVHQPVPCMHCENAPCEAVCPVAATVHSSEGLNDMVYNRCVGTRYCSNNCPYKVRRFNFFDYRAPQGSPVYLQSNPDVTIRERGVMEKCTYCVQRINAGRVAAEKENRRIRDGEIRTACQQACPVEAIVFGDLNDPTSRVFARQREGISYALLGELNTRPRTQYLAKVVAGSAPNPAPEPA
ncbi:MAG: molybdopterin oxidoreductase, iron-sulfur binding subunit [Verrucomicrobia bacterium]|nr:molybdopterin oxidoreductase, iron-sulfur binding subunit [Verrucomicrobiota bacterium]